MTTPMQAAALTLTPRQRERGFSGRDERGNVLPLFALGLGALLGVGALVTDVGYLYAQRLFLRGAADAAALAGVRELPRTPGAARDIAAQYAGRNGVGGAADTVEAEVTSTYVNADSLRVTLSRAVPLFLAKALGISQREVRVTGTAVIGVLGATRGLVPLGVKNPDDWPGCAPSTAFCFQFGQQYTVKSGPGGQLMGNFQALAIDGPGADVYRRSIHSGSLTSVTAGSYVPTQTGNVAGPTRQGLRDRIGNNPRSFNQVVLAPQDGSSYTVLDPGSPQLVLLPIIEELVNPSEDVLVQGFALFFIEDFETQGNDTYIYGYFIDATLRAGAFAPLNVNYGARKVRLVQ